MRRYGITRVIDKDVTDTGHNADMEYVDMGRLDFM